MSNLVKIKFGEEKLTYSKRKTLAKYRALLSKKVWSKAEIQSFKSFVNSAQYEYDAIYKKAKQDVWNKFYHEIDALGITQEQSDFGIKWLTEFLFKQNGEPRDTKATHYFNDFHYEIVRDFSHFKFEGYHVEFNGFGTGFLTGPIYSVYSKSGRCFEYAVPGLWCAPILDQALCRG